MLISTGIKNNGLTVFSILLLLLFGSANAFGYDLVLGDSRLNSPFYSGDTHSYTIYLTSNQVIHVQLKTSLNSGSLDFGLFNSDDTEIKGSHNSYIYNQEIGMLELVVQRSGVYTIKVWGSSNARGIYDMNVTAGWINPGIRDNNRTIYSSYLTSRYASNGNYEINQGDDYFRFTASNNGSISIRIDSNLSSGYLNFKVYNQEQIQIANSDNSYINNGESGTANFTIHQPSGLFYLAVIRSNDAEGNYDLNITNINSNNDSDGDGLYNSQEYFHGSSLLKKDTNLNGVTDYNEIHNGNNPIASYQYTQTQVENAYTKSNAIELLSFSKTVWAPVTSSSNTWYYFDLESSESALILLKSFLHLGSIDFEIYNESGTKITDSNNSYISDGEYGIAELTTSVGGRYYVKVIGHNNVQGNYQMIIYESWFNSGINDCHRDHHVTYNTARCLVPDNYFVTDQRKETYRFGVESGATITFTLDAHMTSGSLNFKVYSEDGTVYGSSNDSYIYNDKSGTCTIEFFLPEECYLQVTGSSSALGNYDLSYSGAGLTECDPGCSTNDSLSMPWIPLLLLNK